MSLTISHYQILKKLGEGGMGEVYLAQDTRLDRVVALKILPADVAADRDRLDRFRQEAKAAATLSHPNVCVIHEVGETQDGLPFIVMEYIQGQTIEARTGGRPLGTGDIIDIGIQIADALDEAHGKGVIHRDIKPSNLILTPRDQVKVLDFGLAKVKAPTTVAWDASTRPKTAPGTVVGTADYMSPEQALGQDVDHRTDIFSVGVVLYQLATGRRPFSGASAHETMDRIIHSQPDAIARFNYTVPAELERIIRKCLEKDREQRYQSARELVIDLKRIKQARDSGAAVSDTTASQHHLSGIAWAAIAVVIMALLAIGLQLFSGGGEPIDSLAVLPFVNVSGDPNLDYLSDGITESLINNVSQLSHLKVIAHTSVFRYKRRDIDAREVGRKLGVQAVLTGRVRQRGDDLFISTELADARDNRHIWGQQYNRKLTNLLTLQQEISGDISEKLRLRLTGREQKRLAKQHTEDPKAYQFYLKGRYFWNKRTEDGIRKAIEYFQRAIDRDPNYALAYTGLADSYALLGSLGYDIRPPVEVMPRAKEAAVTALAVNNSLAEAHSSLAYVYLVYDWDWRAAEREFKRAIELNPNSANAQHWYSHYLMAMGRAEESLAAAKRAEELDPLSPAINTGVGRQFYFARRYDQAIEHCRKTLELEPAFAPTHLLLGSVYAQKLMYAEAIATVREAMLPQTRAETTGEQAKGSARTPLRVGSRPYALDAALGYAFARSGERGRARAQLDALKTASQQTYVPSYYLAAIYVGLGEKDQAFEWLEKTYEERYEAMIYLKVEPGFDNVRSDPRFQDLLRRMGFPP